MIYRFAGAAFTTFALIATPSRAEFASVETWATDMAVQMGIGEDGITRDRYREIVETFVSDYVSHYRTANAAILDDPLRGPRLRSFLDATEASARNYAATVERSVFRIIDPSGTGRVSRQTAIERLTILARAADVDRNGTLDACEQSLAEAWLSGEGLADAGCARPRRR